MTTEAAANLYLAQHLNDCDGRRNAVYNPRNLEVDALPIIYGFNNGGSAGMLEGVLVSADGKYFGGHCSSHEGYMRHDLGILEGSHPDRHETFKKHYPDGYRMEFVGYNDYKNHPALHEAARLAMKEGE